MSTCDRFDDVPGHVRGVRPTEITGPANDWNPNIRRYVDNSSPFSTDSAHLALRELQRGYV